MRILYIYSGITLDRSKQWEWGVTGVGHPPPNSIIVVCRKCSVLHIRNRKIVKETAKQSFEIGTLKAQESCHLHEADGLGEEFVLMG